MSDMNFEFAKRVVDAEFHSTSGFSKDDPTLIAAKAYLAGHASRDPEVANLDKLISRLLEELSAERETVEKLKAEIANHSSIDCVMCKLVAEREASRKLVEAVKLVFDYQEAGIISLEPHRLALFYNAIKPYTDTTPGHSPEGKDVA